MIAVLTGGTGLTVSALVSRLLADAAVRQVISVSRKPMGLSHAKLTEVLLSDLAEIPSMADSMRGDLYFCCLGTTIKTAGSKENFEKVDHTAVVDFAKIAKLHAAQAFVLVSATGADAKSRFFYNQVKGRTEDGVKALGLRSLSIFRPALLVGPRRETRLAETIGSTLLVPLSKILPEGAGKSMITQVETLAAQMLEAGKAAHPGMHTVPASRI